MTVKSDTAAIKKLNALLKKISGAEPMGFADGRDPVAVLLLSFLMWESSTDKAHVAYEKLRETTVDLNDLRVSMAHELVESIGERYPRATERTERIRAMLGDIFQREHAMSFERLEKLGKREIRKYVESLDGICPYVASRVLLLCYDSHGIPVDDHLARLLVSEGAAPDLEVPELAAWLSRQIKASDGAQVHFDLQAWADVTSSRPASRPKKKTASTKTKRKPAPKPAPKTETKTSSKKKTTKRASGKTTTTKTTKKSSTRKTSAKA